MRCDVSNWAGIKSLLVVCVICDPAVFCCAAFISCQSYHQNKSTHLIIYSSDTKRNYLNFTFLRSALICKVRLLFNHQLLI